MKSFPKLKYPLMTKGLTVMERNALLAYDMIWRTREIANTFVEFAGVKDRDFLHDVDANLANLGHFIEAELCAGDASVRFEVMRDDQLKFEEPTQYDHMTSEQMVEEFKAHTEDILSKN